MESSEESTKQHDNLDFDLAFKEIEMVLKVFQIYRGDIGYVQGMSQFAYIIYHVFQDEFLTFEYFTHLILKKYPLFEFFSFKNSTVKKFSTTVAHFAKLNLKSKSETTTFFIDNMIDTYLYSIFFTLFVGFFEESDIFVILDLFTFQNHYLLTYLSIIVLVQFAKTDPVNFNLADLKLYTKEKGLQNLLKEARNINVKLQDVIKYWETHFNEKSQLIQNDESDNSCRYSILFFCLFS
jgi:hypothetical protein